jgi:hypothetical protein
MTDTESPVRREGLPVAGLPEMARLHDDGTVVVLRGTAVEAYALPGWPGRIAVEAARDLHALLELAQAGR